MNLDTKELFILFCAVARMNNEFPGYLPASALRRKLGDEVFKNRSYFEDQERHRLLGDAREEMKEHGVPN